MKEIKAVRKGEKGGGLYGIALTVPCPVTGVKVASSWCTKQCPYLLFYHEKTLTAECSK